MPKTIQSLQDDRAHKLRCAEDVVKRAETENRVMTDDECIIVDKATDDVEKINGEIKAMEAHLKRTETLNGIRDTLSQAPRITQPAAPATRQNSMTVPATAKRYGRLRAFVPRGSETLQEVEEAAYRCGMFIRAKCFNDQRAARWCENNGVGQIYAAAGENINTDGGFLVPEEFSQRIIDRREAYGVCRQQIFMVPMGRDTMMIPRRLAGLTIGPIGENPSAAISQSNVTWNQVRLTAKKCGGLSLMSTEIAEDAVINLADWVVNEFAYAFALFEDQCCFIGDGTSTYMGIRGLGNLFTTTGGVGGGQLVGAVDAATNHDTFAEIDATDLATLMGKLPAYVQNPKFYCSKVAAELVFGRLQAVAGGNNVMTLTDGKVGRNWLGHEIVISQVCPTSTGDLSDVPMLYFGDLSLSSSMGDRRDVRVFPSEHRYMDTDQIGIRGTERIDIVHHDVGDTTTGNAGPIVALVGE